MQERMNQKKEYRSVASIDELYDALRAAVPTYSRFVANGEMGNPYSLEDNETLPDSAWGIIIESGTRAVKDDRVINHSVTTTRDISVIVARNVYEISDSDGQINEEAKELLLDAQQIRDNFLNLAKFGVLKTGEEITYNGDNGVDFLQAGKFKGIFTKVDFTFELIETIN